jgi:Zn-dependent protease
MDEPLIDSPGLADAEASKTPPAVQPDPLLDSVRKQLLDKPRGSPWGLLLVTLAVFLVLGRTGDSMTMVIILAGVILVHELGHAVTMRLLGYRDVRILFLPLLGGAASGRDVRPGALRSALVSLMGPLPGLVLGYAAAMVWFWCGTPMAMNLARVLFAINLFNLLPFPPLDGGRVLQECIFSRRPLAELLFKLMAGGCLLLLALVWQVWLLAGLMALILLSLRLEYRMAVAARALARELPPEAAVSAINVPPDRVEAIYRRIVGLMPLKARSGKNLAARIRLIWHRMCSSPASVGGTVGLLSLYLWSVLGGAALWVFAEAMELVRKEDGENFSPHHGLMIIPAAIFLLPMVVAGIIVWLRTASRRRAAAMEAALRPVSPSADPRLGLYAAPHPIPLDSTQAEQRQRNQ